MELCGRSLEIFTEGPHDSITSLAPSKLGLPKLVIAFFDSYLLQHFIERREEVRPVDMPWRYAKGVDISAPSVNAQTIGAECEQLPTHRIQQVKRYLNGFH